MSLPADLADRHASSLIPTAMPSSRIALIDCTDGTGHHARYGAEVARALHEAGCPTVAIGPAGWCQAMAEHAPGLPLDWRFPAGQGYRQRNQAFRQFCRLVIDTCRREGITSAHFLYIDGFLSALLDTWNGHAPSVTATLHWYPFLSRGAANAAGLKQWAKGRLTLYWMKQLAHRGASFGVHAREAQRTLESNDIGPVHFLPYPNFDNAIVRTVEARSTGRRVMGLQDDDRLFLCFGGTRHDKGCDLALQALARTPTSCHLLIAGNANDFSRSMLERLSTDLGVQSRVHLDIRHIPDDELGLLFSSCDAVVLPYRHTFSGQSGPLITAVSLGIPVVASRLKVFEETLDGHRSATLVSPEDVTTLAEALAHTATVTNTQGAGTPGHTIDDLARFRAGVRACHGCTT